MKRTPLTRKTPLARGDATLVRREALRPGKGKARPKVPPGARRVAMKRSRGRCVVCGARATQTHHVLPVREWPELARLSVNMVGVCEGCHDNHERAHRRIRWTELPSCAIVLAHKTSGAAAMFLERTYPR